MKKIMSGVVLSIVVGFSSVAIAASDMPIKMNGLKCHKELTRADGSKVMAYFSASDCKKLKHHMKGEKVELV